MKPAAPRNANARSPVPPGAMLMGFGLFNVVEGVIDHQLLGLHHVNETVPREQWVWWDVGFLLWGAAMFSGGWLVLRSERRQGTV